MMEYYIIMKENEKALYELIGKIKICKTVHAKICVKNKWKNCMCAYLCVNKSIKRSR